MIATSSTPENITVLEPNEVFVFGSNLNGFHNGGAARVALDKFGAVYGQPTGPQGDSYAIPTMTRDMKPLAPKYIRHYADVFIEYATANPQKTFYLTKVGCGIAGHREPDMALLFEGTPDNVIKPEKW